MVTSRTEDVTRPIVNTHCGREAMKTMNVRGNNETGSYSLPPFLQISQSPCRSTWGERIKRQILAKDPGDMGAHIFAHEVDARPR